MIPRKVIDEAIAANGCAHGLAWAKAGHTYNETLTERPIYYLWGKGKCPSWEEHPESLAEAAKNAPNAALRYAAQYLSPESLATAAKEAPLTALEFAAQHLTPELLEYCKNEVQK